MTRCSAALIWRLPPWSSRWRCVLPELAGIGATPAARASLAGVAKRWAPAISPTSLAAISGPNPGSASNCGAIRPTSTVISRSSWLIAPVSSRRRRSSSRAIRTRIVCCARASRRPMRVLHFFENNAPPGSRSSGPQVVQMPQQRAVELDAMADQPFAVVDQQPHVELGPVQVRGREPVQALLEGGAGDVERVDRIRLGALAGAPACLGGQVRRGAQHPLAALDQKPSSDPGTGPPSPGPPPRRPPGPPPPPP